MKSYFSMKMSDTTADIDIYGDIKPDEGAFWGELFGSPTDFSAYKLSQILDELPETVAQINVNINSYGGDVSEGLAIYNALKRQKAKVVTTVDGFACSIASVIFMAGSERRMGDASLLMIHNASMGTCGTSEQLRKAADDLDTITQASKNAYMGRVSITEDELTDLMDHETWILPEDAVRMGFATEVAEGDAGTAATQCAALDVQAALARPGLSELETALLEAVRRIAPAAATQQADPEPEPTEPEPTEPEPEPEPTDPEPNQEPDDTDPAQRLAAFLTARG